jgi:alpha-galactosidase
MEDGTAMKITTIGAGSVAWGPAINTDFLLNPALDGAELTLMDVSPDALERVRRLLERYVGERGFRKTVTATTDLTEALRDADYVITAISVGGDRLWRYDAMFPHIYGIYQPVGDSIGPGGLVRALRHAGPLLDIARRMREVSAPDAVLIQLTNPMNPLCAAIGLADGPTTYGICHGIDDTVRIVAGQLGLPPESVAIDAAGNNHLIWCDRITVDGEVYLQERFNELVPALFDTPFRRAAWERYGGIVGNHSRHPIEYLPDFLTREYGFGTAWEVAPVAGEIDPMRVDDRHDHACDRLTRAIDQPEPIRWRPDGEFGGLALGDDGLAVTGHSREGLDDLVVALATGSDLHLHVNIANEGAIAGVSPDLNLEVPVTFRDGRPQRRSVAFPPAITAEIERVGREQHLIAQACVSWDEDLLVEALSLDALVPTRDLAARLVREMTAFQREYLARYYPV